MKPTAIQSTFETLADGLEASVDGRGWNAEHERARRMADAAPELLESLEDAVCVVEDTARRSGDLGLASAYDDLAARCRAAIRGARGE